MGTALQIVTETLFLIKSAIYTLLGLFFRPSDYPYGEHHPVILIPGLLGSQFVWGKLRRQLIANGYPVYVPKLGFQIGAFQKNGRKLEEFIVEKNLKDVYIIAHSSGGIIATQMGYKGRDRIRKLFAVSVPFHGTLLGLFIFFIPAGRQLIPWSAFMKNNEVNFMTFSNLQCLYSRLDLTIVPGFQARLGRNDDIEFDGIGHLNIFMSKSGVDFIMDRLHAEDSKEEPQKIISKPRGPEKTSGQPAAKPSTKKPAAKMIKPPVRKNVKTGSTDKSAVKKSKVKPSAKNPKKKV